MGTSEIYATKMLLDLDAKSLVVSKQIIWSIILLYESFVGKAADARY